MTILYHETHITGMELFSSERRKKMSNEPNMGKTNVCEEEIRHSKGFEDTLFQRFFFSGC